MDFRNSEYLPNYLGTWIFEIFWLSLYFIRLVIFWFLGKIFTYCRFINFLQELVCFYLLSSYLSLLENMSDAPFHRDCVFLMASMPTLQCTKDEIRRLKDSPELIKREQNGLRVAEVVLNLCANNLILLWGFRTWPPTILPASTTVWESQRWLLMRVVDKPLMGTTVHLHFQAWQ